MGEEVLARLGDNRSLGPRQHWYLCGELVAGAEAVAEEWKDKRCQRELELSLLFFLFMGSVLAPVAKEGESHHGQLKEPPTLCLLMNSVYPGAGRLQAS